MGKRKLRLSVQQKNHERKRWGYFPVRIPLKGGVSVFKVSVPLSYHVGSGLLSRKRHFFLERKIPCCGSTGFPFPDNPGLGFQAIKYPVQQLTTYMATESHFPSVVPQRGS